MENVVKAHTTASAELSKAWMSYFLSTIVLIGFPLCTLFCIPFFLLSFVFQPAQKAADAVMQWGIHLLMKIQPWVDIQMDIQIPPNQGVLLVSNHRSHLDVFLLLSQVKGIRILAKQDLLYIPFLGVMLLASRQILVRRGRLSSFLRAMNTVRKYLKTGETVHVFPEMTRCEPGFQGVSDFVLAPFQVARETGVPVIPLVIQATDEAWPRGAFALKCGVTVSLRTLSPVLPKNYLSTQELCAEVKKQISQELS